jgi:hypothetical protein
LRGRHDLFGAPEIDFGVFLTKLVASLTSRTTKDPELLAKRALRALGMSEHGAANAIASAHQKTDVVK